MLACASSCSCVLKTKSSGLLRVAPRYMAHTTRTLHTSLSAAPPNKAHEQRGAEQERQQVGLACVLGAHFKKWNYPCSLVVLSKHPFFFTAPHKEPFDIFLMESAKPTFGGKRHPPTPLSCNTQPRQETHKLASNKLSHQATCPP